MSKYNLYTILERYANGEQLNEDCVTTSNIGEKSIGTKKPKNKKSKIQERKIPNVKI